MLFFIHLYSEQLNRNTLEFKHCGTPNVSFNLQINHVKKVCKVKQAFNPFFNPGQSSLVHEFQTGLTRKSM